MRAIERRTTTGRGDDLFSEELLLVFPELFTTIRALLHRPRSFHALERMDGKQFIIFSNIFFAKTACENFKNLNLLLLIITTATSQNFAINFPGFFPVR